MIQIIWTNPPPVPQLGRKTTPQAYNNANKQSKFIRYLRSLNFDIMTFQETHVSDNILSLVNAQFQAQHSLWSRHCGIVSFSPSFVFSTNLTPENDRTLLTKVTHPHNAFVPFYVLVVYAPATSDQHRSQFFNQLFDVLHPPNLDINLNRLMISLGVPRSQKVTYTNWMPLGQIIHFCRFTCCIGSSPSGPGLWRGNTLLARNPAYQQYLRQHLEDIIPKLPSEWSPAKSWDHIKLQVKQLTRTFAVDYTNWRTKTIRKLQSNRNKFLRSKPPLAIRLHQLPIFDQQIASLQQELTDILALKASVRWQEAGETSIKYLKSIYRKRTVEQHITTLRSDDNEDPVEGTDQLLPITQQFYQSLYDADPVDDLQLDSYHQGISDLPQVTSNHYDALMAPIIIDEIIQETARVQNKISSPGEDGLGYVFLYQLFRYPLLQELVLKVYSQAHNSNIFTHSWQELRVIPSLINRCQTGFMPNRFIAENGLVLNIIMEHARKDNRQEIALLLDQEKAYDWVYPSYLRSVLLQFGFPTVLVNSLIGLFFDNWVRVNINGHFTDEVTQSRSLRQGDPLSPLLFNLALEPFLMHVLQDTSLIGFSFLPVSVDPTPPPALKVLIYADDVSDFLSSSADFLRLQHHLHIYGQVSNAKVNLSKTEAAFLSGKVSNQ
ncbi:hypothetical protein G6F20_009055 [Rhizopus arrhizus]|nr:hypothetical protein G6F20_009055 [Rhizopus arrhizus]